jgi:hypothetical protein
MSIDVKFSATDAGLTTTILKVKDSVKQMDKGVKDAGDGVSTSFAAMAKAGAGLAVGIGAVKAVFSAITGTIGEFKAAIDLGGDLNDLSKRTGETAGNLLLLQQAFGNTGVSADKVGPTINKMQKFMDDAGTAGSRQAGIMDQLGLTLADLAGKTPTEQMQIFAEQISGIEDPTKRGAMAMGVFGKAGGELLPLLSDFSGELAGARTQLGSMPDVMDVASASFDGIGDAMAEISKKTMQFAAGLLSELAPAIELVTTLMSQFDAAAAGVKLGEILTGASEAMGGFSAALDAVKIGEFSLAFDIAFQSIRLQAKDSINSIVANLQAAAAAAGAILGEMFRFDGAMMQSIFSAFQILANKVILTFSEGIRDIFREVPGIGKAIDEALYDVSKNAEGRITSYTTRLGNELKEVPSQFIEAIKLGNVAFDKTVSSAKKIYDTTSDRKQLEMSILELSQKQNKIEQDNAKLNQEQFSLITSTLTQRRSNSEIIAEIEKDIVKAKASGNQEAVKELEMQKLYFETLEKGLQDGMTYEKAIEVATRARELAMKDVLKETKDVTKELREQVGLAAKLEGERKKSEEQRKGVDPSGRQAERHARLLENGNFIAAKNLEENIHQKERLMTIRTMLDDPMGSLADMMKENGIPMLNKTQDEMLTELEKVAKALEKDKKDKDEKPKPDPRKKEEEKKETMQELVTNIRDLVKRLDQKLPQHALS